MEHDENEWLWYLFVIVIIAAILSGVFWLGYAVLWGWWDLSAADVFILGWLVLVVLAVLLELEVKRSL